MGCVFPVGRAIERQGIRLDLLRRERCARAAGILSAQSDHRISEHGQLVKMLDIAVKNTMPNTLTEQFHRLRPVDRLSRRCRRKPRMAKHVALDGLAVMLAGATEPLGVGRISIEYVKTMGGAPQASVIAGGFKTSLTNAAYANGTMAHALDFDNTWYPLNHPTSPTLPAILAIAEHHAMPGRKVIEAIAVAFEVQGRLRLAATGLETGSGFHKPGMTGTFGATAGAGRLLNLTRDQMLMAFGLAGSRAGSISINTGTMTKSSHSGHAARMGVECAVLVSMGWTASRRLFESGGFFDTFFGGRGEPHLLVEGFAKPLRMIDPGVGFKKHPSNYFTHRPIDAALALRAAHKIDPAQIESVEVVFPRFEYVNRPFPETASTARSGEYTRQWRCSTAKHRRRSRTSPLRTGISSSLNRVQLKIDDPIPNVSTRCTSWHVR